MISKWYQHEQPFTCKKKYKTSRIYSGTNMGSWSRFTPTFLGDGENRIHGMWDKDLLTTWIWRYGLRSLDQKGINLYREGQFRGSEWQLGSCSSENSKPPPLIIFWSLVRAKYGEHLDCGKSGDQDGGNSRAAPYLWLPQRISTFPTSSMR